MGDARLAVFVVGNAKSGGLLSEPSFLPTISVREICEQIG
jgi:hypothetical protein